MPPQKQNIMKKLTFIIIKLLLVASLINAQEAPKDANLIQIKTSDNIEEVFMKVGRTLGTEGIPIETVDRTFYMIVTEAMEKQYGFLGAGRFEIKLNFQFDHTTDGTIINIRGNFRETSRPDLIRIGDFSRIRNRGMNNSVEKETWKFMDELAQKSCNGEFTYIVEKIQQIEQ